MNGLLYPILLPVGALLPGWLLGRALGAPAGFAGALLGSAAVLMNLMLVLDAVGRSLTGPTLLLGLGIVGGILAMIALRRRTFSVARARLEQPAPDERAPRWLWVPIGLGLLAIAVKVGVEPLSGYDNVFRWDFLARQILHEHELAFYPPVAAADFLRYGWCDGIAPLITSLYLWSYLSLGDTPAWATTPLVVGQAILLFRLVHELASLHGGRKAGWIAAALLSTSAVLLWGVAIGQETGMTALALVALLLFLEKHRREPAAGWLIWAGIAAGVGALAREYGIAFLAVGGVALAAQRAGWRDTGRMVLVAAIVAAPWYLRNWFRTGNPLFSHELGGLFPTNPVHVDHMHSIRALHAIGAGVRWSELAGGLLGLAGLPLALGLAGGLANARARAPLLAGMLMAMGLWLWSIAQTAGGWVYSLRVLTPAVALGAVLAAVWLAPRLTPRRIAWATLALALVAIDAGPRSLHLPMSPAVRWWQEPTSWRELTQLAARWRNEPLWRRLVDAAERRAVLAPDPVVHRVLIDYGATAVPIFSPTVEFLFDPRAEFGPSVERLRAQQIRFVMTTQRNPVLQHHLSRYPFWQGLSRTQPQAALKPYVIYDLWAPDLIPPPAGASPP